MHHTSDMHHPTILQNTRPKNQLLIHRNQLLIQLRPIQVFSIISIFNHFMISSFTNFIGFHLLFIILQPQNRMHQNHTQPHHTHLHHTHPRHMHRRHTKHQLQHIKHQLQPIKHQFQCTKHQLQYTMHQFQLTIIQLQRLFNADKIC